MLQFRASAEPRPLAHSPREIFQYPRLQLAGTDPSLYKFVEILREVQDP
ncbi:MAG: hypothetical protein ACK54E_12885 [Pseudanabaena sp.]